MARIARVWHQRIRSLTQRGRLDDELDRELAFHLDQLVAERIAEGLPADEARRVARQDFGNLTLTAERSRDERRVRWFDDLRQDIDYGWRLLRRSPVFATVAVLSIGVSVGANAALVAAIDRTLLRHPPLAHADRLVYLDTVSTVVAGETNGVTTHEFLAWRSQSTAFDALEATHQWPLTIGADASGPAERLTGNLVTAGYFDLLGMPPLLGRTFTDEETRLVSPVPAVVIGERFWRRRFGADPAAVGATMRINGEVRTIVGVLPDTFRFQHDWVQFWLPLRLLPQPDRETTRFLRVMARLAPGTTEPDAKAELDRIGLHLADAFPESQRGARVRLRPIGEALFGWSRVPLITLQAAAALVWFVACANVSGLLLSRGLLRRREIALRVTLGARRGRLQRQLLTESLLIAIGGAAVGLGVARVALLGLSALRPPLSSPALGPMALDGRLLAVVVVLSLLSTVIASLVPALSAARSTTPFTHRRAGLFPRAGGRRQAGALFVTLQVALALTVMIGAGLLVRSSLQLSGRPLPVEPTGALTFEIALPHTLIPLDPRSGFRYFDLGSAPEETFAHILDRLRDLPGVTAAGASSYPAINALILPRYDVTLGGRPRQDAEAVPAGQAIYYVVTPDFFRAMGTDLLRGREVALSDTHGSPWVVVVNDTAARRFWPGRDPIGEWLTLDTVPDDRPRRVVGVVPDIPLRHGAVLADPVVYTSFQQQPRRWRAPWPALFFTMTFVVRTSGDPHTLLRPAQDIVAALDPDLPLSSAGTILEHLDAAMLRFRYDVLLLVALAGTAVVLAAIGLYGMVAGVVGERTREIGIRKSFGASAWQIVVLVGRRTIAILVAGLAIGICAALLFTRLVASQLWGIGPTDPVTYVAAALMLVGIAALATALPTRRALRVDPATILRDE